MRVKSEKRARPSKGERQYTTAIIPKTAKQARRRVRVRRVHVEPKQ